MTKKEMMKKVEDLREGVMRLGAYASEAEYMGMPWEADAAMQMQRDYFDEIEELKEKIKKIDELENHLYMLELHGCYEEAHYVALDIAEIEK